MEIKVYPFSFMEYLTYYEITDGYDDAFDQYVRTGGMPGAYVYKTEDRQYDYVRDVYSTILVRDLVEKYKIRNKSEFTNISEFMMDNIGNLLSPNNISKTLNNDRSEITRKTVSKYIGYLENAFLFYEAKRYDLKGKKYLANNSKYYLCDSSFRYPACPARFACKGLWFYFLPCAHTLPVQGRRLWPQKDAPQGCFAAGRKTRRGARRCTRWWWSGLVRSVTGVCLR